MRNDPLPLNDPGGLGIFSLMAKALAPSPFQPDFRKRWERVDPAPTASPAKSPTPELAKASPPEGNQASPPEGNQASTPTNSTATPRRLGLMERLERWFWAQQQRDVEAYLAQSADIHELEVRMRNLERGRWHRYN